MTKKADDPVVAIVRDLNGKLYSEVVDRSKAGGRVQTVERRAEALAAFLGVDVLRFVEWRCLATEMKQKCRCPECEAFRSKDDDQTA